MNWEERATTTYIGSHGNQPESMVNSVIFRLNATAVKNVTALEAEKLYFSAVWIIKVGEKQFLFNYNHAIMGEKKGDKGNMFPFLQEDNKLSLMLKYLEYFLAALERISVVFCSKLGK